MYVFIFIVVVICLKVKWDSVKRTVIRWTHLQGFKCTSILASFVNIKCWIRETFNCITCTPCVTAATPKAHSKRSSHYVNMINALAIRWAPCHMLTVRCKHFMLVLLLLYHYKSTTLANCVHNKQHLNITHSQVCTICWRY